MSRIRNVLPIASLPRLAFALVFALASGVLVGSSRAQSDDEQTIPTGWWYIYDNVGPSTIADRINQGYRPIDLDVVCVSPLLFNAVFVQNTGPYAKAFWWYYGVDANFLGNAVQQNNARIISLQPYGVNGQTRFAAVMISNTGADAAGWWWFYGTTLSFLSNFVNNNPARIIDIERYRIGSSTYFSAVMIQNLGAHQRSWWWYVGVTPSFIASKLESNNARLIDIEAGGHGTYDVVMQLRAGVAWWLYYDITPDTLRAAIAQNGARLIELNQTSFDHFNAIMISN